jgi:surface antigen
VVATGAPLAGASAASLAGTLKGTPFQSFTDDDTRQFEETARTLADAEKDGASLRWANDATGAWGTLELKRSFKRNGAPCREMRGENTARGRTEPFRLVLCRTAKGEWRIVASGVARKS